MVRALNDQVHLTGERESGESSHQEIWERRGA
jgi:hypothetical protein